MKVIAVILNFNGKNDTLECLTSLYKLKTEGTHFEVIVIDNASVDGSVAAIRTQFPQVAIIQNQENMGFAKGNNTGITAALAQNADYVWLLNNDVVVEKNCLAELINASVQFTNGGIFGAKIYFYKGKETHKDRYTNSELGHVLWYAGGLIDWPNVLASHRGVDEVDSGQFDQTSKTQFITGCSMFVRRNVFEKVGLLDEKLYLYYEDVDFSRRAQKKGFELYFVPSAILWHKNAGSSGGSGSDLHVYYMTRNRLILGMRYAPWRTKLALWREGTKMLARGTRTQRSAVGDFLRKKYGKR